MKKIENYLGFIRSDKFAKECGPPSEENTTLEVYIHPDSDPKVFDLLDRFHGWVSDNYARLHIRKEANQPVQTRPTSRPSDLKRWANKPMGYAISWIAFKDKTAAGVQECLSLVPTGKIEDMPEGMFSATKLGSWYLVFIDRHAHEFVGESMLQKLSVDCEVVAATVEEHVMFSSAEYWSSGKRVWSVVHDAQVSTEHLVEAGSLPASFLPIKERLFAAQKNERDDDEMKVDHIFDAPLELAETLVGFKHDKVIEVQFEVLKQRSSGGFFAGLFGKK